MLRSHRLPMWAAIAVAAALIVPAIFVNFPTFALRSVTAICLVLLLFALVGGWLVCGIGKNLMLLFSRNPRISSQTWGLTNRKLLRFIGCSGFGLTLFSVHTMYQNSMLSHAIRLYGSLANPLPPATWETLSFTLNWMFIACLPVLYLLAFELAIPVAVIGVVWMFNWACPDWEPGRMDT